MSRVLTNEQNYYDIADTIRQMKNVNTTYKPREMASALKDIYSNEVEGTLPLSFESNGMDLLNYRIDGASGGVGDKTNNLFDLKKAVKKKYINSNGDEATSLSPSPENTLNHSDYVSINSNVNYTFTCTTSQNYSLENTIALCWFDQNKNILSRNTMNVRGNINNYSITALSPSTAKYLIVNFIAYVDDAVFYLNEGTTTVFEPYGYKVPVVISGKNLFDEIYTNIVTGWDVNYKSIFVGEGTFTLSTTCPKRDDGNATNLFFLSGNVSTGANSGTNGVYNNHPVTVTSLNGYVTIGYRAQSYDPRNYTTMLNEGTTALPYEPYIEETTNIYLDNPIRTINDEIEYIDYSEQKQHRVRKNLLQNTATTQTINGVTFTVNNDKSITCNGTATGTAAIAINTIFSINSTKISGCPMGGSWSSFELDLLNINTNNVDVMDTGNGAVIQNENSYRVRIRIANGYTCNNLTFYPMIRKADIEDDTYEPYIENTEVDVTLPAIPTLDGTNTLSIGTTVQPSNVYIQARKDTHEMYEIKSLLQPSLNKFGANISTLNPIIDYSNVINDIYDKLPKVTQSGAGFTLLDVQNGQVDDFKMNGVDLSQSGTPTPDNPQEIKVVEGRQVITDKGKNLFTLDNFLTRVGQPTTTGNNQEFTISGEGNYSANIYKIGKIKDYIGKTLTFKAGFVSTSTQEKTAYSFISCDSNGNNRVELSRLTLNDNNLTGTYTIPSSLDENLTLAIRLYGTSSTSGSTTYTNTQIEEGSIATDYEPYHEAVSYNIDLSLENIQLAKMPNTTYKNRIYKNNGNWYFEENVKKVIFDGSEDENWTAYLNTKNYANIWQGTPQIMCNYFNPTTNKSWISSDDSYRGMCSSLNAAGIFKCMTLTNMTIAEFKTWLSTHNVIIWYELQNPITRLITNTTLINQLETISVHTGTNIITISNDNNIIPEIEITRLKELEKLA